MKGHICSLALFATLLVGCAGDNALHPQPSGLMLDSFNPATATPLVTGATVPGPPASDVADLASVKETQANPSANAVAMAARFDVGAVAAWNQIAREIVAARKIDPPMASRLYTVLAVAQRDAALAAYKEQQVYRRTAPYKAHSDVQFRPAAKVASYSYPSEAAAIAEASVQVIRQLVPAAVGDVQPYIDADLESRVTAGVAYPSDVSAGVNMGDHIAEQVIAHFADDGSDMVWSGSVPTGPGFWYSMNATAPLRPLWGQCRTNILSNVSELPVVPPPAFGSAEFQTAVQEVRQISDHRTPEQTQIALFWADGGGTATPPGHWNKIAVELFPTTLNRGDDFEVRGAQVLAYLNMAMMDAGIVCWKAKYDHWLLRPTQADPAITLAVPLPNFPSYTSGHSSFSGAAAEVLSAALPAMSPQFRAMANEAAMSRVYGGIHYRFDSDEGLRCGKAIGELAASKMGG